MGKFKLFWKNNGIGYLFLTPWIIGILTLTAIPMGASLYFSFTSYDMFNAPTWIGLENYEALFSDPKWLQSVKVTFIYVLIGVPLQLAFALFIAVLLNKGIGGLRIYRAVYYVPSLFGGSVAIAILWRQIFGGNGLVNNILDKFGLEGINWISTPDTALYTLIILMVWQFGASMVIFLAGLKQVPIELYESAKIDGAGAIKAIFYDNSAFDYSGCLFQLSNGGDYWSIPSIHSCLYCLRWNWWSSKFNFILYIIPLSKRVYSICDGICFSNGLDFTNCYCTCNCYCFCYIEKVGLLSRLEVIKMESSSRVVLKSKQPKHKREIKKIVIHSFIIILGIVMLYPLFWMVSSSFKQPSDIFNSVSFFPSEWTMDNYTQAGKVCLDIHLDYFLATRC